MVMFLYSDKNYEHQAMACVKSLTNKITDDVKIIYYTIGFDSGFEFKNLIKVKVEYQHSYPTFHFYKAELSLITMRMFPDEYYLFTDTDVLFSRNFDFNDHRYNEPYPMASYGPHEYPFSWREIDGVRVIFDETKSMKYYGIEKRSMRYCWSCFYAFNPNCKDFLEEWVSMCQNRYLLDRRGEYLPYADETAFNICLWRRGATKNLGHAFTNTHSYDTVKIIEESEAENIVFANNVDAFNMSWESVKDPDKILLYHGFKEKEEMNKTVDYLLSQS
jgi:hypothetical protein